jgi:tetratricopeptide (TPR) repeat protein
LRNKSQKKSQKQENPNAVQTFKRILHRGANPRRGLASARARTDPLQFPTIVKALGTQSIYRALLAPTAFPPSIPQFTAKPRLQKVSEDMELLWAASVLSLYQKDLAEFVTRKNEFFKNFCKGEFDKASKNLNLIQSRFGVSLWLLGHRLQILQLTEGLKAQKDFLEQVVSTTGLSQVPAWVLYYFSVRSEENVSYANLVSDTHSLMDLPEIGDYAINHIIPYDISKIKDIGSPLAMEEPHPIIDRYETFVKMALLYAARHASQAPLTLRTALELLREVNDAQLNRLLALTDDSTGEDEHSFMSLADAYTLGQYDEITIDNCENLELVARSRELAGSPRESEERPSIHAQIIQLMRDVLSMSPSEPQSRLKLQKMALFLTGHPFAYQIAGFLERRHDHLFKSAYSELDKVVAISGPLDNPWSAPVLKELGQTVDWMQRLMHLHPQSPSVRLHSAICGHGDLASLEVDKHLPQHRANAYLGHIAFRAGNYELAANRYSSSIKSSNEYIALTSKRYLFDALYAKEDFGTALGLVVGHILSNPSVIQFYPLDLVAKGCLEQSELRSDIRLAVLLHLAAKHSNQKWERDLSDVYENIIDSAGIQRPSDMVVSSDEERRVCEIYFLRFVCVPRILDDTTCFESVDEIDAERIAVCQKLLQLDPPNDLAYRSEIRAITRDSKVAHLLAKVQTSKIYVDEAGIKQTVEPTLKHAYARYIQLLDNPGLAYQAEKLSKRLGEMLNSKGHPEFRDLKLPASELEGLFQTMLYEVVSEFALNPAYGLDTHVSTTIRHGAFEGHLRGPLTSEDLLCSKQDGTYAMPATWVKRLAELQPNEQAHILKHLIRFTQKFDELIASYLKGKLHIRDVGNTVAMFDFEAEASKVKSLMESVTRGDDYLSFVDKTIAHCWEMTDRSLKNIRDDIQNVATKYVNQALDTLVSGVESSVPHERIRSFVDAIARARTAFQVEITDVSQWFHKPTDLSRDPFDFELAVHVALQQIANCYVKSKLIPKLNIVLDEKLEGRLLDSTCELLFILFQNVVLHGGFGDGPATVRLSAWLEGEVIHIECANILANTVSLDERRQLAQEALQRYERDSALRLARREGGSGLSKLWRICEYDLGKKHSLGLEVTNERDFITRVSLSGLLGEPC